MQKKSNVINIGDRKSVMDVRKLLDNPKSNCCGHNILLAGTVTHYYVCKKCMKPCDAG